MFDEKLMKSSNKEVTAACEVLKSKFGSSSMVEALGSLTGLQQQAALMLMNLLMPEMAASLASLATVPLHNFTTSKKVVTYLEALIDSGVAAEMERGLAFVLGNTGAGKTSLVNTLQEFVTNPTNSPQAWLTEEHTDKLETQVMEVYDGFNLKNNKKLCVEVEGDKPGLVQFREQLDAALASDRAKQCVIRMLDIGGHQEYYCCTTLFLANSATFLVCLDVQKVQEQKFEEQYYACVGSYLDLVVQGTQGVGMKPKIVLVATKVEETAEAKNLANKLLDLAKTHLKSLKSDVYLADEVMMTSSKNADRANLEDLFAKLSTLSSDHSLSSQGPITTPLTWWTLLTLLRNLYAHKGFASLEEVAKKYKEVQRENGGASNLTEGEMSCISKLKEVALLWTQDVSPKKVVPKEPLNGPLASTSNMKVQTKAEPKQNIENITVSSEVEDESTKEVRIILDYFLSQGEIWWYKTNPKLKNIIIPTPMDLIRCLRTLISHKTIANFDGVEFERQRIDLRERGLLTYKDFLHLYELGPKQVFTAERTWEFLIELGLGCSLESGGEKKMMVPCLLTEDMEENIKKNTRNMEKNENSACIGYTFNKDCTSIGAFYKFFGGFAKAFLWGENGGDIHCAFSQKVESRKLGIVCGIEGSLKWHTQGIREPKEFDFQVLEYETSGEENEAASFAVTRGIRIHVAPTEGEMTKDVFQILLKVDTIFSNDFKGHVKRRLFCKPCMVEGKAGFLDIDEGIQLVSDVRKCSKQEHKPDKAIVQMMNDSNQRERFVLKSLMDRDKEALELEVFESSMIKRKIMEKGMVKGEQIWVYHDGETDPNNLMACRNPYAHVLIYVGWRQVEGQIKHEVVHVKKDNLGGLMKATIARESVLDAIQPHQHVFLGHRLDTCQFAGNVRDQIAKRALACVDPGKKKIVFDYDHR